MASVFWDAHGILFIDYLEKGKSPCPRVIPLGTAECKSILCIAVTAIALSSPFFWIF